MQITFTGPRGCGKSTTLIEVAKFLKECGMPVKVVGHNAAETRFLQKMIKQDPCPEAMHLPLPIILVDSQDEVDESSIRCIAQKVKTY